MNQCDADIKKMQDDCNAKEDARHAEKQQLQQQNNELHTSKVQAAAAAAAPPPINEPNAELTQQLQATMDELKVFLIAVSTFDFPRNSWPFSK